jgi:hypothetical protein
MAVAIERRRRYRTPCPLRLVVLASATGSHQYINMKLLPLGCRERTFLWTTGGLIREEALGLERR